MSQRLPRPLFGLDYVGEIPTSVLRAAGVQFVYRYLGHYGPKVIRPGEFGRLSSAGIGLCLVFEDYGMTDHLYNYADGKSHAEYALNQAHALCGKPKVPRPIAFAVDTDRYTATQVREYANGWAAVMGKANCGPYGSFAIVSAFANAGFAPLFQTYAWSYGAVDGRARVLQYSNGHRVGGYDVDFDHAFYDDYGQWGFTPAVLDPLRWFPTRVVTQNGVVNEHKLVQQVQGALQHPKQYRRYLKGQLRAAVKRQRDRCWSVAHWSHPPAWNDERHLGWRWQYLNNLLKKIDAIK